MNQRQEKIIQILQKSSDWMKGSDLAALLEVTPRTIRNDIEGLRRLLPEETIESSPQKGYRIASGKKEILEKPKNLDTLPQTPAQRQNYILKLLISEKEVNVSYLPSLLYVSPYTIEGDIRQIRSDLADGDKLVLRSGKNRIWIEGDELEKRRLYKELLSSEVEENFLNLDRLNALYPEFDLIEVRDILLECLSRRGCQLRETAATMVYMHLGIALQRLIHFHSMPDQETSDPLRLTREYQASEDFFSIMARRYQLSVPEAEVAHLALLLMGRGFLAYADQNITFQGKQILTAKLIEQMLDMIENNYSIDLHEDRELVDGLELHLRALFLRSEQNVQTNNVYLDEIRWKFPLFFDMAVSAAGLLQKETGAVLDQNEIGFLALHFGNAYTRLSHSQLYRVLVLFPHDASSAMMVVNKIARQFSERIEIVACLNAFEEKKVRYYHPDLILSSLPLTHSLDIPTVPFSVFYSQEDESMLFQALNRLDRQKNRKLFESRIQNLILEEFFFTNLQARTPEEVIDQMCLPLQEKGLIPSNFRDAVKERESYSPTAFAMGFALPHSFNVDANRSVISVAFLEHPIRWGSFEVDFALLLAVREEDRDLLTIFFDWWIQIAAHPVRLNRLKNQKSYQAFMKTLLEDEN